MAMNMNDLILSLNKSWNLNSEVLTKIPHLITAPNYVDFDLGGANKTRVPSIPSMQRAISGEIGKLNSQMAAVKKTANKNKAITTKLAQSDTANKQLFPRIAAEEKKSIGFSEKLQNAEFFSRSLMVEISKMLSAQGNTKENTFWDTFDLSKKNTDGNLSDPEFRAEVEDGIRFALDADVRVDGDRKSLSQGHRLGEYLMPKHSVSLDKRYTSPQSTVNVSAYAAFSRTVTRTAWKYQTHYYGYYYYNWRYYWYGRYYGYGLSYRTGSYTTAVSYTYKVRVPGIPLSGSMIAQTFQVKKDRTLLGFNFYINNPAAYKAAATPSILLVKTEQGKPLLDQVIARGKFRDDVLLSKSSSTEVYADLDIPVIVEAGVSYAVVVKANAAWYHYYNANQEKSGGFFYTQDGQFWYTQDGQFWTSELQKDLCFSLRLANFGAIPQHIIDMKTLSASGGIAGISLKIAAQKAQATNLEFQVNDNGTWRNASAIDNLQRLPASSPVRAIFRGNADVMPLVDVENTYIRAFRPSNNLSYISKLRSTRNLIVKINCEVVGFNQKYHSFSSALIQGGKSYPPLSVEKRSSTDGRTTSIYLVFKLPAKSAHQLVVKGATSVATQLFDISSIVEVKG